MELITEKKYNLFSSCKLVRGKTRGIICDLQRNEIYPIPLSLCTLLEQSGLMSIQDVITKYGTEEKETIIEYFEFLVAKDIVFFSDHPEYFPPMEDQWDEPFQITNSIIDFQFVSDKQLVDIKNCIGDLPIKCIQLRIFCEVSLNEFDKILQAIKPEGINSLEVLMKYNAKVSSNDLSELINKYPYIFTTTVFGSPEQDFICPNKSAFGQIFYVTEDAFSEKDCGLIKPEFFTINTKTFTESLKHNSCLNRKISIDSQGEIKNCPSMNRSYGNISETTFEEAIAKKNFKDKWDIHKDKIKVCKDCEFRYICTDCRAYIEDPNDKYSKPLKCGYDPYTGEWSDWMIDTAKHKILNSYNINLNLS